jgi:ATP-dependent Clp protease ATP-binding subunit ClpA
MIELAMDEARRRGQTETEPDNLYVAMFNARFSPVRAALTAAGADVERVLARLGDRLLPSSQADSASVTGPELSAAARDVMERAAAQASSKRTESVTPAEILIALIDTATPLLIASVEAAGTTPARLRVAASELGW